MAQAWAARVDVAPDTPVADDAVDNIHEALHAYAPSVGITQAGALSVLLAVEAGTLRQAADEALRLVKGAAQGVGAGRTVTHLQVQPWHLFEAEVLAPAVPELMGLADIAELLGVSRQRARELADTAAFPDPVQRLRSGPLFIADEVRRFHATWTRRSGRPRRTPE